MSTAVFRNRPFHLEHVMVAALMADRYLGVDARRLSLLLSTWGHRGIATPTDARLLALLGWSGSRLSDARLELTIESTVWDVDRDPVTHAWTYLMTLGDVAGAEFPPTWDTSAAGMANYVPLYANRSAIKRAARYCGLPSAQAITLAVLSASLDFTRPDRWAEWSPWHAAALEGISPVREAVEALEEAGYIETQAGSKWRFTPAYAAAVAETHQLQSTASRKAKAEDAFEQKWISKHAAERAAAQGGETPKETAPVALETGAHTLRDYYLYTLSMPEGCPTTIAGVEGTWHAGDVVYVGMTTSPERRLQEHASVRGGEYNPALRALKDALLMSVDPMTGESLRFVMEVVEVLPNSNKVLASIKEREMVKALAAAGHPIVNRQYIEDGLDFISAA